MRIGLFCSVTSLLALFAMPAAGYDFFSSSVDITASYFGEKPAGGTGVVSNGGETPPAAAFYEDRRSHLTGVFVDGTVIGAARVNGAGMALDSTVVYFSSVLNDGHDKPNTSVGLEVEATLQEDFYFYSKIPNDPRQFVQVNLHSMNVAYERRGEPRSGIHVSVSAVSDYGVGQVYDFKDYADGTMSEAYQPFLVPLDGRPVDLYLDAFIAVAAEAEGPNVFNTVNEMFAGHTVSFSKSGPVFDVPDGISVYTDDLSIVNDNQLVGATPTVPEPSGLRILAVACVILRRRPK